MSEIKVTNDNFTEEVLSSELPVLVDFWASWCGPCRMLAPVLEEIARENEGKLVVAKVNVDEEPVLANRFGIASIPTLILFKNGKAEASQLGYVPKAVIEKMCGL